MFRLGFPGGSDIKESACNVTDQDSIPGPGRSPGEGNGYPLQYSCLKNSMDREAQWVTVHSVSKHWLQLTLSLSMIRLKEEVFNAVELALAFWVQVDDEVRWGMCQDQDLGVEEG